MVPVLAVILCCQRGTSLSRERRGRPPPDRVAMSVFAGLKQFQSIPDVHSQVPVLQPAPALIQRIRFLEGIANVEERNPVKLGETVPEMLKADLEVDYHVVGELKKAISAYADQRGFDRVIQRRMLLAPHQRKQPPRKRCDACLRRTMRRIASLARHCVLRRVFVDHRKGIRPEVTDAAWQHDRRAFKLRCGSP